jgi:hypothetical protein
MLLCGPVMLDTPPSGVNGLPGSPTPPIPEAGLCVAEGDGIADVGPGDGVPPGSGTVGVATGNDGVGSVGRGSVGRGSVGSGSVGRGSVGVGRGKVVVGGGSVGRLTVGSGVSTGSLTVGSGVGVRTGNDARIEATGVVIGSSGPAAAAECGNIA